MNDFITELLERLTDLRNNYTNNCTVRVDNNTCRNEKDCGSCVADQAIEIVNQLIEEKGMVVFDDYISKYPKKKRR